jgi:serine/threonine protein kinase
VGPLRRAESRHVRSSKPVSRTLARKNPGVRAGFATLGPRRVALEERNELDDEPAAKDALATTAFGDKSTGVSARREPAVVVVGDAAEDEGPDPMIGRVLSGLYKVQSRIGRGGMGTVYMAVHIHLDKPFAVKVLSDQIATNKSAIQRLLQEARTASSIDHDNIVDVFSFDATEDGRVFLVMELLEGVSLSELVERGPMRLERALPIARQVCQALEAAHARGVVHRDLKPENVFICRKRDADFVKVLDFGISKVRATDAEQVRVTKTGQLVGTPLYMSPEQARGELDVDHRADVYALGVMLFEMLTGHPPFEGTNYFQLLWKHGNEPAPSARTRVPELPEALDRVLLRALEKKPDARFQTMRELEEALVAVAPELGSPDRLISLPPRQASIAPSTDATTGPRASAPTPVTLPTTSRRPWWVALAAIFLLAGGFAAARLTGSETRDADPATGPSAAASAGTTSDTTSGDVDTAREDPAASMRSSVEAAAAPSMLAPAMPEGVPPPASVEVRIVSTPSGATVRIGEETLGRTPIALPLPAGAPVEVQLRLSGYAPERFTLTPSEGLSHAVRLTPRPRSSSGDDDLPIRMSL